MALQLSDVPANFPLLERSERTRSNVTQSELDLGWIKGYYVHFQRVDLVKREGEFIYQTIDVYPIENVNQILALTKKTPLENANESVQVDELSDPKIGDSSEAFRFRIIDSNIQIIGYGIIFTKKDVVESIVAAGTSADYQSLEDLVKKAAEKIR